MTIPGSVPELMDLPAGCAFSDRCSLAVADCLKIPPQAEDIPLQSPLQNVPAEPHRVSCPRWSLI
jgi:oligopeptide/dipeptide ABC transporter ATP-binding protein